MAASPSADANACTIVPFGPISRCQNFYDVAWPKINASLDTLYAEAKSTDGGQLVIWDWYEQSPDTVKAFNARFPDIKVKSQGFTYNTSSAIITAKAQGKRNSDIVSGSLTSMTAMYDQGFWAKVDWTQYGVPKEFFTIGAPEMLPDSVNGPLMHYDSTKTSSVPGTFPGFAAADWKGKLAIASFDAQNFSGYGMKNGQDAMTTMIANLKANGLVVSDKADTLLSSGDVNAVSAGPLYDPTPGQAVAATQDQGMYVQFSGVNSDAKNPAAAKLWVLWNAYDPAWLKSRMTDPTFNTTSEPYPGLPSALFATATGLMKANQDAWFPAIENGSTVFETLINRDQYNTMIDAASKAVSGQ